MCVYITVWGHFFYPRDTFYKIIRVTHETFLKLTTSNVVLDNNKFRSLGHISVAL